MASGMEMAMSSVFKWLGLDPKETVAMFFGARDAAFAARDATARIEARLEKIENDLAANRATLDLLLKLANGEKPNGHANPGTDRGGSASDTSRAGNEQTGGGNAVEGIDGGK